MAILITGVVLLFIRVLRKTVLNVQTVVWLLYFIYLMRWHRVVNRLITTNAPNKMLWYAKDA